MKIGKDKLYEIRFSAILLILGLFILRSSEPMWNFSEPMLNFIVGCMILAWGMIYFTLYIVFPYLKLNKKKVLDCDGMRILESFRVKYTEAVLNKYRALGYWQYVRATDEGDILLYSDKRVSPAWLDYMMNKESTGLTNEKTSKNEG